ncbi:MAG TPA: hypothetical protein PLP19_17625 [bacterium]|nr:hypothetical protein [bacterium]
MNCLLTFLWRYTRVVKNYVLKRLDLVTRIEIVLFFGFLLFYCLFAWNREFSWTLKIKGQVEVWQKFVLFCRFFILFLPVTAFTMAGKRLRTRANDILLALPVPGKILASERLLDLVLPLALFYPLWLALYFLFARYAALTPGSFVLLAFALTGWYFFAVFTGLLLFIVLRLPHKLTDLFIVVVMAAVLLFTVILAGHIQTINWQWLYALVLPTLTIIAVYTGLRILTATVAKCPERLAPQQAKARLLTSKLLLQIFTLPTPRRLVALVVKDCTFTFRNYKSFIMIFLALLIILVIGIAKSSQAHDGIQWFLSINIAAAWILANAAFRFVDQRAESLAIIRSLPIKPVTYWWAKFWQAFLPVVWLVIAGTIIFILKFGFTELALYESITAILFIAFTLIFMQTNFALYSYPYPRYAVLWYNLYLILAVAFFTVLLSPLITIGFLLFGYGAIFLVLKRINNVEIIND